jgi:serine/threonine protein kinase
LTLVPIESNNRRVSRDTAEVGSTTNSYQILAKLATGGMAEIFLARGEGVAGVERYCVLKRILRDRAGDVNFVRMFLDEARLAAQLQHPNIAQVYDIGKLGDSYFFTMEYVHGETVRALLHRAQGLRRRLPIHGVLTIAAGTAAGLHHAHARLGFDGRALGIVHRDVSPSNLMVSYEGGVKVVDFGVAKAADRAQETKSGTVKGKISYLSPEQCKGKRVDRRSDLFSLGICFWEMLTTERLFRRASDFENMSAIVSEATPPPSSRRPDVPPEIDELVLRLLAKDPDERFQTADEVVDAIEAVAARTSTVLSASALGRLVRELFGQRPEPWLELERGPEQGEAVTVTSEPIPRELLVPAAERVNQQLSSVVDLSSPPSITESLDPVPLPAPLEVPTARLGTLGTLGSLGFPLAAPPPTPPRIRPLATEAQPPVSPQAPPATPTLPSYPVSSPPSADGHTQSLSYAMPLPPSADADTQALAYPVAPPPGSHAHAASSGQLILPAPGPAAPSGPHVTPSGPRSASFPAPPGPRSGPHMTPSGTYGASFVAPSGPHAASFVTSSGSHSAVRPSGAHRTLDRPRAAWPLYAVIGSAALLGSIAVVLMMRSGSAAMAINAASAAMAPEPMITPLEPLPVAKPADVAAARAEGGSAGAPAPGVAVKLPGDPGEPVQPAVRVANASLSRSAGPPVKAPVAPRKPVTPGEPSGVPRRTEPMPRVATQAPARSLEKPEAQAPDEIGRAFSEAHYDKVILLCSAGPVNAEHAPMCFMAACYAGNEARARKLITAVPAVRRDLLITNCKQFGVDITVHKTADKPAEACEADPMACQH